MRQIHITLTADQVIPENMTGRIAVVIDVLRATSVIATALANGAARVRPVAEISEAQSFRASNTLLGGERHAEKIEGFDLGNSPLEYTREKVGGKEIVLTTTNGTRALNRCREAHKIFTVSFVNCSPVVKFLRDQELPLEIVCAGTNGEFSLDDFLLAGMMCEKFFQWGPVEQNDLVKLATETWKEALDNGLHHALRDCKHYNILKSKGFKSDLDYCLTANQLEIIPVFDASSGVIRPLTF
jgi:2-phosphosulfolactate phosphatase